ncbi:hypothetical protein R1sor_023642 [Riccia sorocarpa]|uniref:C2 domain-containing protein n=1 Tax=Riccia sorocarpa TaxID=122646 RepID=A0ABD3GQ22_9MARC
MGSSNSTTRSQSLDLPAEREAITDKSDQSIRRSDTVFPRGVLNVQIFKARNIQGKELKGLGKADPYVVVKLGSAGNRDPQRSETHHQGGSSPIWHHEFAFPLRNGGTMAHNTLDLKIFNENANTHCCRQGDTCLGSLRIENLAEYILSHKNFITEPQWYPVLYKKPRSDEDPEGESKGEILIKFYFLEVNEDVFAKGYHTSVHSKVINGGEVGKDDDDRSYSRANGKVEALGTVFDVLGSAAQIGATFIPILLL